MDVVGKIIAALPPKSGTSQSTGKPWQVNTYVLQTNEQTPKNIAFDVFGAERVEQYNLKVGDMVTVSIDIDAHEYNGRWYNQIRAWNVVNHASVQQPTAQQAPPPTPQPGALFPQQPAPGAQSAPSAGTDQLPF